MMDLGEIERKSPKTKISDLFKLVDKNTDSFIDKLKEAVSIPSIAKDPKYRDDVVKMLKLCEEKLKRLGFLVTLVDGNDKSQNTDLPPVIFAELRVNEEYKTICVYGNIDFLAPEPDVQPSAFTMTEKEGRFYGSGVSDNKAPLLCWFNALKMFKLAKIDIPVNVKFIIEATSESYSVSLLNAIESKRDFFGDVEFICLTIDRRIDDDVPCLKYGYRGLCHFLFNVSCGEKKVHGGTYGGAFNQPLMDTVHIVSSLINKHGKCVVPEFLKDVKTFTEEDDKWCKKEVCDVEAIKRETGLTTLSHKGIKSRLITHKTRLPSISVNSFSIKSESADRENIASIPNKIEASFAVRLVPNQKASRALSQFGRYIENLWSRYQSANDCQFEMTIGLDPWQGNPSSNHYKAAEAAIKTVYNVTPKYVTEGNTIPIVSILGEKCPGSNMVVMPISGKSDNHHTKCESISRNNYIKGVKLLIAYMCEVHELTFVASM
ncbi:hypothetical protein TKK_0017217 [Trichogramma kaykai]